MAKRETGFDLKGFRDLLKDLEDGMVAELKELKEEDPEGFEEYDFRLFKSHIASLVVAITDLGIRDFFLFVGGDEVLRITNEEEVLEVIDTYYKSLKQFYDDVMRKVKRG